MMNCFWLTSVFFGKCSVACQRSTKDFVVVGHTISVDVMTGKDTCSVSVWVYR